MSHSEVDINGIKAIVSYASKNFIICCHGLYSSKESKKYTEMEEIAYSSGFSCVRFDFRGCGESKGNFINSTLSNRLKDLIEVVSYLKEKYGEIKISLLGSSFGGMVSILYSYFYGVKPIVLLSTPYKIDNGIEKNFLEDLKKYDLLKMMESISHVLIIHGERDELVPVSQARKIYEKAKEPKKLILLDSDHSFSDDDAREKALQHAIQWIKENI